MSGTWERNGLRDAPHSIRPETHWLYEECGYSGGPLWFSLQLSHTKAAELRDAFTEERAEGDFRDLIKAGARIAPASHASLCMALEAIPHTERVGTDLLVPIQAFDALQKLTSKSFDSKTDPDIEIVDAGLAGSKEELAIRSAIDAPTKFKPRRTSKAAPPASEAQTGAKARRDHALDIVIIAIIDDAIGIANTRFRKAEKETRIAHFMDLGPPCAGSYDPEPKDELLARSWEGAQIDSLLAEYPDDDEQVYRILHLIARRDGRQPLRAAASHGTHMLDTAAGYDCEREESDQAALVTRPIIAVQLPPQVPEDRSDRWLPQSLKRALDWILVKADELSGELTGGTRRLPLIVNCSFGSMAGPKDGQSDVELRIAQFIETYRAGGSENLCTVVLSAGNFLLTRTGARVPVQGTQGKPLCWRLQPDDKTPNLVEIWGPEIGSREQQISVTLKPPRGGSKSPPSHLNTAVDWKIGDTVYARLYHQIKRRPGGKWRELITIATRPTADDGDGVPVAPFGAWEIEIDAPKLNDRQTGMSQYIYLRVHRNDPGMFTHSKGRQSYFDDPLYERFDPITGAIASDERVESEKHSRGSPVSPVIMQGTLSGYGYANGALVVGGYRRSDGKPAVYSSSGATDIHRSGSAQVGPNIAAVTEESAALWGILGTGTFSGSVNFLNGTSVAAPLAVRALADEIARGGTLKTLIKSIEDSERNRQQTSATKRPLRFGVGRLPFKSAYRRRIDEGE